MGGDVKIGDQVNPWARRVKEDILEGLEAMGDDTMWLKEELEGGFLRLFRDADLAEAFGALDFSRLREGAYACAIPPPGWAPSQVPVIESTVETATKQEPRG